MKKFNFVKKAFICVLLAFIMLNTPVLKCFNLSVETTSCAWSLRNLKSAVVERAASWVNSHSGGGGGGRSGGGRWRWRR